MDKITKLLENKIEPFMERVDENKVMIALKSGFVFTTPFIMIGSLVAVVINFPWLNVIAPDIYDWLSINATFIYDCTYGVISLLMLIGISSSYAKEYNLNITYSVITSILSFMVLLSSDGNYININGITRQTNAQNIISLSLFDFNSLIFAVLTALFSIRLFVFFSHHNPTFKKLKKNVSLQYETFRVIYPTFLTLIVSLIIRNIFLSTHYLTLNNFIYEIITKPLVGIGNNIVSFVLITQVFANVLWFFGIHGTNVVNAVWDPILETMSIANISAFESGQAIPYIISGIFRNVYGITNVYVILIALIIVGKSKRLKKITKMSAIPAIFCISEPMVYGIPIFLNPILFIPYVICSSIQFLVAYFLCYIGFAPIPVISVPWTTPIFLNVLVSTNWDFRGVITQITLIIVGLFIWIPFIKILDKRYIKEESKIENSDIN